MSLVKVNDLRISLSADIEKSVSTVYQVLRAVGKEISCFCYSEQLSIAGNCRVCLVEVSGLPKLQASCALPWSPSFTIFTSSVRVKRALEGILEFLLINHPLDCPICDQGGECDLQDLSLGVGSDKGRFYEYSKRSVIVKDSGPFIKTILTRCIHCTRCVRFFKEILLESNFTLFGRGEQSEIAFTDNLINPLSGNVIDLCPVGALTSKAYAFSARPWELESIYSFDLLDSVGSSIRVDVVGAQIMRILPALNKAVNEEWITNKVRFFFDLLRYQRIEFPCLELVDGRYFILSWRLALNLFLFKLSWRVIMDENIGVYMGLWLDLESTVLVKNFVSSIGFDNLEGLYKLGVENDFRSLFLIKLGLSWLTGVTFLSLIFVDLRLQLPVLYARVIKVVSDYSINMCSYGVNDKKVDKYFFFGNNLKTCLYMFYNYRGAIIKGFSYINFLVNGFSLKRVNSIISGIFGLISLFKTNLFFCYKEGVIGLDYSNYYCVSPFMGQIQYLEVIGKFKGITRNYFKFSWVLGDFNKPVKDEFIAFQGFHNILVKGLGGLFLPVSFILEDSGSYLNILGRLVSSLKVVGVGSLIKSNRLVLSGLGVLGSVLKKTGYFGGFFILNFIKGLILELERGIVIHIMNFFVKFKFLVRLDYNFFNYKFINYYKQDYLYKFSYFLTKAAFGVKGSLSVFIT